MTATVHRVASYPHLNDGVLEALELVRGAERLEADVGQHQVLLAQLPLQLVH